MLSKKGRGPVNISCAVGADVVVEKSIFDENLELDPKNALLLRSALNAIMQRNDIDMIGR